VPSTEVKKEKEKKKEEKRKGTGQASASYLQRRLKLGYSRAARLIEIMKRTASSAVAGLEAARDPHSRGGLSNGQRAV